MTNAFVVVATLIFTDLAMSLAQEWFPQLGRLVEGLPVVLINDGQVVERHMKRARVNEADILERAASRRALRASTRSSADAVEQD